MNIYRCSFPPCRAKSNGETKEELRARGWVFKRDEILCAAHATVQALFTVTGGGEVYYQHENRTF